MKALSKRPRCHSRLVIRALYAVLLCAQSDLRNLDGSPSPWSERPRALTFCFRHQVLAPFPADDDEESPNVDVPRPLAHGQFMPAISPAVDESVEPNVVAARVAELQMSIGRLQRLQR